MQFLRGQSGKDRRKLYAKSSAPFLPIVAVNPAGMLLHDAEANAETEPGSFADGLCRIERIENAVRFLDARTGIEEKDDDVSAVAKSLNREDATLGRFHGVDGVADHVEKNLHQLVAIAANSRQDGFELEFDADSAGAEIERAKLHGIGHHGVDVQEGALRGNLPGEAQEIADERLCAASLIADFGC